MRIERLNKCCGSRGNLSAVDFQPHSQHNNIHRIATSGGTYVQIWAISRPDDKLYTIPVKCVLLFSFKEHSPYDVTTVRWSPNGQYLASTDSGGITNILKRNERKSEIMEKMIVSKLSGENAEIPDSFTETAQVTKYTIKYDGTDNTKRNSSGISRISLNSKSVQVESKEVKSDNLNLLDHNNPDGNLECWEALATLSCPNNMGQLFDISWAPDNRSIIGGGMNGHVIVFDIHTKEIVAKFDALENTVDHSSGRGYIKSVSWDPMTLFVAVQSSNKEISIWRRSPPLPPGSPMKWTFKRVLYHDQFSETSNADVLGGSRISWAPNGKSVVFPNSSINSHNFSTCYQIVHNTASFIHMFSKPNYDKNQVQYHFDMNEHNIESEPLLLRGHTARIRNVRFSADIMKPNQYDGLSDEKYFLLAQSSDDNVLSIWRFRIVVNAIVSVECVCVIKNFLDEQSSIEDLSWGDFGRCLAVASSQGGLVLIQFSYEDIGARFHTNRIQGLNLKDMKQPSADFFSYSEQVNDVNEDGKNGSENAESFLNHSIDSINKCTKTSSYNSQNKLLVRIHTANGTNISSVDRIHNIAISNEVYKSNLTPFCGNDKNVVLTVCLISRLVSLFVLVCYRIYAVILIHRLKHSFNSVIRYKRPRQIRDLVFRSIYDYFYLLNVTVQNETKTNPPKRRSRSKKAKTNNIHQDYSNEIWLDMDYGNQNTFLNQYWKDSEQFYEVVGKDNDVQENTEETPQNGENADPPKLNGVEVPVSKSEKVSKVLRVARPDKPKCTRSASSSSLSLPINTELTYFDQTLFSYPVLQNSISIPVLSKKVLGINFLKPVSSLTSVVCYLDDSNLNIFWTHYIKSGHVTHIECLGELVVVLTQRLEGDLMCHLTGLNVRDGKVLFDQLELNLGSVSLFNLFKYTHTYFFFVTTGLRLVVLKYESPQTVTTVFDVELDSSVRESVVKIEVLNTTRNCSKILSEKLPDRNLSPVTLEYQSNHQYGLKDNLAVLVYKRDKTVSIYSQGYEHLELDMELFEFTNNTLSSEEGSNCNLEWLFRFYHTGVGSELFGKVDFDGSMSSVMESFGIEYSGAPEKHSQDELDDAADPTHTQQKHDMLAHKLRACILIGSGWEYLLYLHEYFDGLLANMELVEAIETVEQMYKLLIKHMDEPSDPLSDSSLVQTSLYDVSNYQPLFPHCLSLLRHVVVPCLIEVFNHLNSQSDGAASEQLDGLSSKFSHKQPPVPEFLRMISPALDYAEADAKDLSQRILTLLKNVEVWENMLKI